MNSTLLNLLFSFFFALLSQNTGEIDLQIQGAKSDKGLVRILVFDSKRGYPDQVNMAIKSYSVPVINKSSKIGIRDLKPGKYSIVVFHDEDENGTINTNPFGYPLEKYGFSNNVKSYFGPPDYEKTLFELKSENKTVRINLR